MSIPTSNKKTNEVALTYRYLLVFTTLSTAFFCWLYVTKPTQITVVQDSNAPTKTGSLTTAQTNQEEKPHTSFNQSTLPGDSPNEQAPSKNASSIPLAQTPATEKEEGFEETNDTIQYIVTAQNEQHSERVVIEIPVIYKTRGLRLGPEETKEAQRVLRALMIYQSQIKKLHQDGKNIQKAWDNLLLSTQPIDALRADSPSLPQSNAQHPSLLQENSSNLIQIAQ